MTDAAKSIKETAINYRAPVTVLIAGIIVSVFFLLLKVNSESADQAEYFKHYASLEVELLERKIELYVEQLNAMTGFFESSSHVSRKEYQAFAGRILKKTQFQAMLWQPHDMLIEERHAYVREGSDFQAGDLFNIPAIKRALDQAISSEETRFSHPFTSSAIKKPNNVAIITPLVVGGEYRGSAIAVISIDSILSPVRIGGSSDVESVVMLVDAEKNGVLLAYRGIMPKQYSIQGVNVNAATAKSRANVYYEASVASTNGQWGVIYVPDHGFIITSIGFVPWLIIITGLGMTGLLGYVTLLQARQNAVIKNKVAEQTLKLQESEALFRNAIQYSPQGMALVSPEGRWLLVNDSLCGIVGYTDKELYDIDFQTITVREDLQKDLDQVNALLAGKIDSYQMEKRYIHKDGHHVWILLSVSLVREESGDPRYFVSHIQDISAQKAAYEGMRLSEERYRALYNNTPVMLHSVDGEGRLISVSDFWLRSMGYQRDEVLGRKTSDFLTKGSNARFPEVFDSFLKTGRCDDIPYEFIKKDGSIMDVLLSATMEKNPDGSMHRSLAVLTDVTEKKRAEERLQLAWQGSGDGMWDWNVKTGEVTLSERYKEILGYDKEEEVFDHYDEWVKLVHPDDTRLVMAAVEAHLVSKVPYDVVCRLRKKDEGYCWARLRGQALWSDDGVAYRMAGSLTDISLEKEEERVLKEVYDIGTNAAMSGEERIKAALAVAMDYYGLEIGIVSHIEQELDKYHIDYIVADDVPFKQGDVLKLGETYCVFTIDAGNVVSTAQAGISVFASHPCYINSKLESYIAAPLYVDNMLYGTVNFSSARARSDSFSAKEESLMKMITQWIGGEIARMWHVGELEYSERKLAKLVDELTESNAQLERFAYICSHDLQEPLRMVSAFGEKLEKHLDEGLDEKGHRYLDYMTDGAARARALIADILAFARLGNAEMIKDDVDMGEVLAIVQNNLEGQIADQGAKVIAPKELPTVRGQQSQLVQLFQNLIGNAMKFQKEGTKPKVEIAAKPCDNGVEFTIADNGIGISSEDKDKVFELFKRTNSGKKFAGTGLGLAICKKIVENHNGDIWLESEVGKGTTFHFTIKEDHGA